MTTKETPATPAGEPKVVVAETMIPPKGTIVDPKTAAKDPFTGNLVDPFVGADKHDEDDFTPDPKSRGDFVAEAPAPTVVVLDPKAAEKEAADKAAVDEAAAAETAAAEAAAKTAEKKDEPVVEKKADEPLRDENGKFIPKSRFDEVNNKRKEAERKLKEREAQDAAATASAANAYDFDAAEAKYMEAVLDGRKDEALALRKEIRSAEQAVTATQAAQVAQQTNAQEDMKGKVNAVIDQAVADYAELDDTNKETFNPELVAKIDAVMGGLIAAGTAPDAALAEAVDLVATKNGLKKVGAKAAEPEVKEPAKEPAKPAIPRPTVADKLAAAAAQPASAGTGGLTSAAAGPGTVKVTELTDEQFDALPASTLARLRGDAFSA